MNEVLIREHNGICFYKVKDLFAIMNKRLLFNSLGLEITWYRAPNSIEKALYRRIHQCYDSFKEDIITTNEGTSNKKQLYITGRLLKHIYLNLQKKIKVHNIDLWSINDYIKAELKDASGIKFIINNFTDIYTSDNYLGCFLNHLIYIEPKIKETPKRKGTVVSKKDTKYKPTVDVSSIIDAESSIVDAESSIVDEAVREEKIMEELSKLREEVAVLKANNAKDIAEQRAYIVAEVKSLVSSFTCDTKEGKAMLYHQAWSIWHSEVFNLSGLCLKRVLISKNEDVELGRGYSYIDDLIDRLGVVKGFRIAALAVHNIKNKEDK